MVRSSRRMVRDEALPAWRPEHPRPVRGAAGEASSHGDPLSAHRREASRPHRPSAPQTLAGLTVLVVDDDESSRDYFAVALRTAGAAVATAATATDALRSVQEQRFDVVLSDIAMPDQDGYWLVRQIRGLGDVGIRHVPVVATTAYGRTHPRQRVLEAGFVEHLSKPVEPNVLRAAIARAAGRST